MSTINASHTKIYKQLIKSQTRQINSQLGIKLISNYLSVGKQRGSIPFVNPSRGCLGRDHEIIAVPTWQTSPLGNTQYNAFRFQDRSVVLTKIQNAAEFPGICRMLGLFVQSVQIGSTTAVSELFTQDFAITYYFIVLYFVQFEGHWNRRYSRTMRVDNCRVITDFFANFDST